MRWFKFSVLIILVIFGIYAISMFFVEERKEFTLASEVNYPIEKVYPQFNNLQSFSTWNDFFTGDKDLSFSYYTPYIGQGSSMKFKHKKDEEENGELYIRYENPYKTLRYQLFVFNESKPYLLDLKFEAKNNKTFITWIIKAPQRDFLERSLNLFSEQLFVENIDKSMKNLHLVLGNKVDKENLLAAIKYDTIMVEKQEGALLLGVNVTTLNKKNSDLLKNVTINHNKVVNFVKMDLGRKDDEFGVPVLITNPANFKDKNYSYYYGVPLSKRLGVSDNNFTFRTINQGLTYVMYYEGSYQGRIKSVQQLLQKAKKDTLRNGDLHEEFLEIPEAEKDVKLKLILPVYR